jgi:hypothetical protein
MKLYVILAIVALVVAAFGAVFYYGRDAGSDKVIKQQLEGTIEDAETFNEGAGNPNNRAWFDRLFPDTETE